MKKPKHWGEFSSEKLEFFFGTRGEYTRDPQDNEGSNEGCDSDEEDVSDGEGVDDGKVVSITLWSLSRTPYFYNKMKRGPKPSRKK